MTHHASIERDPDVDEQVTVRPPRPAAIELAAAILIVGGAISLFGLATTASGVPAGIEPFLVLSLALAVGSIVAGLLVRYGLLWVVVVNYAAVLGFLDLMAAGASPLSLMLGLADVVVVIVLLLNKPWFDALGRWRDGGS